MKHAGKTIIVSLVLCVFCIYGFGQVNTETVLVKAERMPEYIEGNQKLMQDIANNVVYPQQAIDSLISGFVVVRVIIDTSGNAIKPEIVRSVHPLLDKAALDVIPLLGKFHPGMQNDKPIFVYYNLPVRFKLAEK